MWKNVLSSVVIPLSSNPYETTDYHSVSRVRELNLSMIFDGCHCRILSSVEGCDVRRSAASHLQPSCVVDTAPTFASTTSSVTGSVARLFKYVDAPSERLFGTRRQHYLKVCT